MYILNNFTSRSSDHLATAHVLLNVISRSLYFHFLFFQGQIKQHTGSNRQSTNSRITVTEAVSASSDEGLDTKIIVHGKNTNDYDVL